MIKLTQNSLSPKVFIISYTLGKTILQIIFIKSYSHRAFQQYQECVPQFSYNFCFLVSMNIQPKKNLFNIQ